MAQNHIQAKIYSRTNDSITVNAMYVLIFINLIEITVTINVADSILPLLLQLLLLLAHVADENLFKSSIRINILKFHCCRTKLLRKGKKTLIIF